MNPLLLAAFIIQAIPIFIKISRPLIFRCGEEWRGIIEKVADDYDD